MQIPILRLGEVYESADLVELSDHLVTHTANPGLIRRDLLRIKESKAALDRIPAEKLADYCEAAAELFLSVKTVDYHLQSIYRKLQLRSRTELAVLFVGERETR